MSIGAKATGVIEDIVAGKGILEGNKAINSLFGGVEWIGRILDNQGNSLSRTFKQGSKEIMEQFGDNPDELAKRLSKADWDTGKIAGAYMGTAALGRVASGGGVYRDKSGNANLIGVPFV